MKMTNNKLVRLVERFANFDCFQPWGVPCDRIDDSGEQPCEACEAKAIMEGYCLACSGDLSDPELKPTHPTDQKGRVVCDYCWQDFRAECKA